MTEYRFKICIFGDGGVGKTTLITRYLTGAFIDSKMTLGVEFHVKSVEYENDIAEIVIWDFAGNDRYMGLVATYLKGAMGGICMYDITRHSSFKNLNKWLSIVKVSNRMPIILVGGKLDLKHSRSVYSDSVIQFIRTYDFIESWFECSSKTGYNVDEIFLHLGKSMIRNIRLLDSETKHSYIKSKENRTTY